MQKVRENSQNKSDEKQDSCRVIGGMAGKAHFYGSKTALQQKKEGVSSKEEIDLGEDSKMNLSKRSSTTVPILNIQNLQINNYERATKKRNAVDKLR